MKINGKTAVCGLIGQSVEYSLSPFIQNTLAEIMGINSVYVGLSVKEPSEIGKALDGAYALGIKGINVTVPYKKSVLPFLCRIDESAKRIGAVNTLKYTENGYEGYNTDVFGVSAALEKNGIDFAGQRIVVLGAGGGAAAVCFAAAMHKPEQIYIANRTNNNSELLARQIKKYYNDIYVTAISFDKICDIERGYFILQATSVGMNGSSSPVDKSIVENSSGVFDIIYSPPKSKILCYAEELGKRFINGSDMLIYQAARAFEIWNGAEVDEKHIYDLSANISMHLKM